jgi:hypothetical protein
MSEVLTAVLTNGVTPVALVMLFNFGFIVAVTKEWIVLGSAHKEVVAEKNLWRSIALQNGNQADKLLENKELGIALLESFDKEKEKS